MKCFKHLERRGSWKAAWPCWKIGRWGGGVEEHPLGLDGTSKEDLEAILEGPRFSNLEHLAAFFGGCFFR